MNTAKIVFVGEATVGKTSIVNRITKSFFNENNETTIGAAYTRYTVGNTILEIWDTAGQERYNSLVSMYTRNANIIIFVFDATNPITQQKLYKKIDENIASNPDSGIVIVGNKIDLLSKDELSYIIEMTQNDFDRYKSKIFYISAKSGSGIKDLLNYVVCASSSTKMQEKEDDIVYVDGTSSLSKYEYIRSYCHIF